MKETWRWFGPDDPVKLSHVRQAGASGIVSALHQLNDGRAWPIDARKMVIAGDSAGAHLAALVGVSNAW